MPEAKYVLVGSSHAALEALRAIRQADADGSMAMLTKDDHLPYSPTILPYVVSGRRSAEDVLLRDPSFFTASACQFVPGVSAVGLDPAAKRVQLADGESWGYDKLLVATGAAPLVPPIPGLDAVSYRVLRSLEDAQALRSAALPGRRAVILGAGLVGLHTAETLCMAGLEVSVVELRPQVLSGYFDPTASARIEAAFGSRGVRLCLGRRAVSVQGVGEGIVVCLDDQQVLAADLLLVATGVAPVVDWLAGSGVQLDKCILVGDTMRTSVADVWAAGDVAQARDFFTGAPALLGIIPTAVDQGRTAGMDMAGDPYLKPYAGGIGVNTYRFFGRLALSVGRAAADDAVEVMSMENGSYRRIVMSEDRLVGYASVDEPFDVGIMGELIRRRVDLSACKEAFLARPLETGRQLMKSGWA